MRVFVINKRNEPLMPCTNRKARILLKQKKAKIASYNPFCIQLLYASGEAKQQISIGVDTGYKHIGIALTSQDKILAKGEIELRSKTKNQKSIQELLVLRSILRKKRRSRKTRYRKPKFLNRSNCKIPPSILSKLNATCYWIDKFSSLVPNPELHIELAKFSNQNTVHKQSPTCFLCGSRKDLQNHHVIYRSKGGSDASSNLIKLCKSCHSAANHSNGNILHKLMQSSQQPSKAPNFMNILSKYLQERYKSAKFSFGLKTSINKDKINLSKTHYNDAIAISGIKTIKENPREFFFIKQFRKKKRSLHEAVPHKARKTSNKLQKRRSKNKKESHGWLKNDCVSYNDTICWIWGFSGSHSAILRDANEQVVKAIGKTYCHVQISKLKLICHNNNWQFSIRAENHQ